MIGSQATSTRPSAFSLSLLGLAMVVVMGACLLAVLRLRCLPGASRARGELGTGLTPLGFLVDGVRESPRGAWRRVAPQALTTVVESLPPGGSSMKGMNLSGKPGIVQPMQMPPTLGQPPTPFIQPRLGTLHLTTGPQQPSLTMHFGEPYSVAKSACS